MAAARALPTLASQVLTSVGPTQGRRQIGPTPEAIKKFEAQSRKDVRVKSDVDADLPGWWGLPLDRV